MSAELANMRAQDSSMDAGDVDVTERTGFLPTNIEDINANIEDINDEVLVIFG